MFVEGHISRRGASTGGTLPYEKCPGGAHFAESYPYRGTGPSEKMFQQGYILRRGAPGGLPDLMKSVEGGANSM